MATVLEIDAVFDGLLEPVSADAPAGSSLRYGPVYAAIEQARRQEDAALPQGVWQREIKRADDAETIALCRDALATKSKDLLIACWLVEAAARVGGPTAAAAGLDFVARLCEAFWDGMHPAHADGDADSARFGPIIWLDGALARLVRLTPIAVGEREGRRFAISWSDHEQARHNEAAQRRAKTTKQSGESPVLSMADFDWLADATPEADLRGLMRALTQTDEAAQAVEAMLAARAGSDAPGMTALRRALREISGLVGPIVARRAPAHEPAAESVAESIADAAPAALRQHTDAPTPDQSGSPAASPAVNAGVMRDRQQAYRALAEIAALLRRVEPHSPTPYLIERAVRWGDMDLSEVLADLPGEGRDPAAMKWLMSRQ